MNTEKFETTPPPENPEEIISRLVVVFETAELALKEKGRDLAKGYLPEIYNTLISLNKLDASQVVNPLGHWNPDGNLSETQFNELNRRRKILSNAIGIMTGSGTVRHSLNPDVPESLE